MLFHSSTDDLSCGLDHAQGVVLCEDAFFDQVMNQAVEQQVSCLTRCLSTGLLNRLWAVAIGAHVLYLRKCRREHVTLSR